MPVLAFTALFTRSLALRALRRPVAVAGAAHRRASGDDDLMALPLLVELSGPVTLVANIVAWATFHTATGLAAHRLPLDRLAGDGWLSRPTRSSATAGSTSDCGSGAGRTSSPRRARSSTVGSASVGSPA